MEVLGFAKVPCTPVTGAFANYFDVFGDVERLGTGSSLGSTVEGEDPSSPLPYSPFLCRSCNKRLGKSGRSRRSGGDSFEVSSALQQDPYIVFLQDTQAQVLTELHGEVRALKTENAELKFQIHVILSEKLPRVDGQEAVLVEGQRLCEAQSDLNGVDLSSTRLPVLTLSDTKKDRERMLELELESATKMIQELKWVQQHYESKIRLQDSKMEDLMKQLNMSSSNRSGVEPMKAWPLQSQVTSPVSKTPNGATRPLKSGGRQRGSVVHPQEVMLLHNRRNSLQSLLPDDYKEQVATLPPILAKSQLGNPLSAIRNPNANSIKNNLPQPRRSSLSNGNNNNPTAATASPAIKND